MQTATRVARLLRKSGVEQRQNLYFVLVKQVNCLICLKIRDPPPGTPSAEAEEAMHALHMSAARYEITIYIYIYIYIYTYIYIHIYLAHVALKP